MLKNDKVEEDWDGWEWTITDFQWTYSKVWELVMDRKSGVLRGAAKSQTRTLN